LIYDNGPINGNTYAWAINFGFVVSDTITVNAGAGYISGMAFGAWLSPGDTLTSADVSITSEPNDGTTYFYQTLNFTQQGCTTNADGFNVLHGQRQLQWPDVERWYVLGKPAKRPRS